MSDHDHQLGWLAGGREHQDVGAVDVVVELCCEYRESDLGSPGKKEIQAVASARPERGNVDRPDRRYLGQAPQVLLRPTDG